MAEASRLAGELSSLTELLRTSSTDHLAHLGKAQLEPKYEAEKAEDREADDVDGVAPV